jgi:hypothetical protein
LLFTYNFVSVGTTISLIELANKCQCQSQKYSSNQTDADEP